MNVYKINDIIGGEFLRIPKVIFAKKEYKAMSSDAKLAYALLYDRLSLSKRNGWINSDNEVYLIYTREELATELGISYKKAICAFKELLSASLIIEDRNGRGMPNFIYVVKPELSCEEAMAIPSVSQSETAPLGTQGEPLDPSTRSYVTKGQGEALGKSGQGEALGKSDMPKRQFKICQNSTSRCAETAVLDVPNRHISKTEYSNTEEVVVNNNNNIYNNIIQGADDDNNVNAYLEYENNIGVISPVVAEDIGDFIASGLEEAVICALIREAAFNNKRSWKYIRAAILQKLKKGIKTYNAYLADEKEWERRREAFAENAESGDDSRAIPDTMLAESLYSTGYDEEAMQAFYEGLKSGQG